MDGVLEGNQYVPVRVEPWVKCLVHWEDLGAIGTDLAILLFHQVMQKLWAQAFCHGSDSHEAPPKLYEGDFP